MFISDFVRRYEFFQICILNYIKESIKFKNSKYYNLKCKLLKPKRMIVLGVNHFYRSEYDQNLSA